MTSSAYPLLFLLPSRVFILFLYFLTEDLLYCNSSAMLIHKVPEYTIWLKIFTKAGHFILGKLFRFSLKTQRERFYFYSLTFLFRMFFPLFHIMLIIHPKYSLLAIIHYIFFEFTKFII